MGTDRVELMLFPEYSTLVSAERNLEEYPLFELKARQRDSKARLIERVIEGEGGVSLRQTWKVIPSGEYGMPGPVDQDVCLAVLQLLEKRGGMPEDGELAFSLYELRKILGWSDDSGGAYREIKDALVRIQLTGVQSSNAFYSAADEQLIADSFNVWSVHFAQRKKRGTANSGARTTQDRHALRFHPIFIRNYEAQYLKGLDSEFFWALKMPLSKRLYRLIDLQRAGGLSWRTDLFAVRDQIPLDYSYASQIKRALRKAHAELEEKGFLSGSSTERVRTTPRACSTASPTPSLAGRGFVQQFELQADVCGERPFSASHQDGRHEQVAPVDQPGLESLGGEVGTAHADVASRLPFHPPDRFGVEVSLDPGPCARYP